MIMEQAALLHSESKERPCFWPTGEASCLPHPLSVYAPFSFDLSTLLVWMASWNPLVGAMDLILV